MTVRVAVVDGVCVKLGVGLHEGVAAWVCDDDRVWVRLEVWVTLGVSVGVSDAESVGDWLWVCVGVPDREGVCVCDHER